MVVVKNEGVPLKYGTSVDYRWFVAVIIIIAGYNRQMMDDICITDYVLNCTRVQYVSHYVNTNSIRAELGSNKRIATSFQY